MDYEKFHNETLRNLQEMVSKGKITEKVAKGICADFVAESEAMKKERVRLGLIEVLKTVPNCTFKEKGNITLDEAFYWLERKEYEKQGEV